MTRWFLNFTALLSTLLCVGLVLLRLRLEKQSDRLLIAPKNGPVLQLITNFKDQDFYIDLCAPWSHPTVMQWGHHYRGDVSFSWASGNDLPIPPRFRAGNVEALLWSMDPLDDGALYAYRELGRSASVKVLATRLPLWTAIFLTAILPCLRLWVVPSALRGRRRRKMGCCINCGYDLRGSSERCPECGRAIIPAQTY